MEIGVCVKRVPMVGGKIVLTADEQEVDTRMSGFTISPHEECAVEEAVQITERLGGTVSVITLGPAAAADQLREALALGAKRAVLLETDGREWGPIATAGAIVAAARGRTGDADAAAPPPAQLPSDLLPVRGHRDLAAHGGDALDADQDFHDQLLIRSLDGSNSGVALARTTVTG